MSWLKNIIETVRGSEDFSDIKSSTLRDILNGNILTKRYFQKQYGLLALLAILAIFYIDNRYYSERQLSKAISLKKEIQDLKYESLTLSAELMEKSRQSNVVRLIKEKGLDLKEMDTPPIVIDASARKGKLTITATE